MPRVLGDVNGDPKVDIIDAAYIGYSFETRPGDARWIPGADLDENGLVDILDAATVAYYHGT